jgi:hypothetical protein
MQQKKLQVPLKLHIVQGRYNMLMYKCYNFTYCTMFGPMTPITILLKQCFDYPSMRTQIKLQQASNGRKAYVQRKLANNGGSMCLIHYRASELL